MRLLGVLTSFFSELPAAGLFACPFRLPRGFLHPAIMRHDSLDHSLLPTNGTHLLVTLSTSEGHSRARCRLCSCNLLLLHDHRAVCSGISSCRSGLRPSPRCAAQRMHRCRMTAGHLVVDS